MGKKITILCDETINRKGKAAFIILFKILPTDDNPELLLVVTAVKILSACTRDQTSNTYDDYFEVQCVLLYLNFYFRLFSKILLKFTKFY